MNKITKFQVFSISCCTVGSHSKCAVVILPRGREFNQLTKVQFKIAFHFFRKSHNFINIYNSCSIIAHKLAIKLFFVYQKTKSQNINQEIKKIHISSKFNEIQSDIMALNYLGIWVCKSNVFSQFTNYHFNFKRMFILNHYK